MNDKLAEFFIPGEPKAQPRVKATLRGRHAGVYTPKTADGWKTQVSLAVRSLEPQRGAVSLQLNFRFERPKSHFAVKGLRASAPYYHTQKPDLDNLAKSTMDAMVDAGFLGDDKLVVCLFVSKDWSHRSGCDVIVRLPGVVKNVQ